MAKLLFKDYLIENDIAEDLLTEGQILRASKATSIVKRSLVEKVSGIAVGTLFVETRNQDAAGRMWIERAGENYAEIGGITVHKDFRGRGISKKLLAIAITELRKTHHVPCLATNNDYIIRIVNKDSRWVDTGSFYNTDTRTLIKHCNVFRN